MSRAKWKDPYLQRKLLVDFLKIKERQKKEIYTYSRKSIIIPQFIDFTFNVHNGKVFTKIKITKEMIGYKLGEFSPTRKKFLFKKKKNLYGAKN